MKSRLLFLKREKNWRILIYSPIIVSVVLLLTTQAIASPISEETKWWVTIGITVFIGLAAIAAAVVIGLLTVKALNSAFRHTESALGNKFDQAESTIEGGFYQIGSAISETTVTLALGSEGDRPNWNNFLQKIKAEAIDEGYVRITETGFITTEVGEKELPVSIQEEIQRVVEKNSEVEFEELGARVVEYLGVRWFKGQRVPTNQMIAIAVGFAERLREA